MGIHAMKERILKRRFGTGKKAQTKKRKQKTKQIHQKEKDMNKAHLIGRLTRDPEVRYTRGDQPMAVANFTLAVDRRFKKDGEQTADFIQCVAFGKLGEHVEKYYRKGIKVAITGHIQTGSYVNKEGRKTYTTKVVADELEFAESKAASQKAGNDQNENTGQQSYGDGFEPLGDDEGLPFT